MLDVVLSYDSVLLISGLFLTFCLSSSRNGRELDNFDPDEQAILRLMHENMRDWDQVNLINTDQLRRKFQEIDPHGTNILTLREVMTIE